MRFLSHVLALILLNHPASVLGEHSGGKEAARSFSTSSRPQPRAPSGCVFTMGLSSLPQVRTYFESSPYWRGDLCFKEINSQLRLIYLRDSHLLIQELDHYCEFTIQFSLKRFDLPNFEGTAFLCKGFRCLPNAQVTSSSPHEVCSQEFDEPQAVYIILEGARSIVLGPDNLLIEWPSRG